MSGDLHAFDPEGHCAKIRWEEGGLKGARMQNTNLGGHGHARTRTDISHLVPNRLIPPAQHPSFLEILVRSISVLGLVSFVKECRDCQGSMEGRKEGTMVATVKILPSQSASVCPLWWEGTLALAPQ